MGLTSRGAELEDEQRPRQLASRSRAALRWAADLSAVQHTMSSNDCFEAGRYGGCDWRWRRGCDLNLGRCLVGPCAVLAVLAGRGPRSAGSLGTAHWVREHSLAFFDGTSGPLIYTSYLAVAADNFGTESRTQNASPSHFVQQTDRYKVEDRKPMKAAANIQALCVCFFSSFLLFYTHIVS